MHLLFVYLILFDFGSQQTQISFEDISYRTLGFYSGPDEIITALGEPLSTEKPMYECGFLSAEEQQKIFISPIYPDVKFTGAEGGLYLLEEIRFVDTNTKLQFGETILSGESRKSEIKDMLSLPADFENEDRFLVRSRKGDDGLMFLFKNDLLIEIHYWSPC
jgi:hypothetical protein